jgi:hypothetical protein
MCNNDDADAYKARDNISSVITRDHVLKFEHVLNKQGFLHLFILCLQCVSEWGLFRKSQYALHSPHVDGLQGESLHADHDRGYEPQPLPGAPQ